MSIILRLNLIAILLAAIVVILGAYTRLTDAGLGCPDWPGCYGFLTVPEQVHDVTAAELAFPERPVEPHKAWNEMIHRYFAGSLGLLIGVIWLLSLKQKLYRKLTSSLLVLVCFQAALGMWTVTMNLAPLVVMGHLLGGFATFSMLVLLALTIRRAEARMLGSDSLSVAPKTVFISKLVLLILIGQIALGGWTAANYAAVVCTELPICEGEWQAKIDFDKAFSVPTGFSSYEYGVFPYEARMTIHIMHRAGAVLTLFTVFWLVWLLLKSPNPTMRRFSYALTAIVAVQFLLGVSNVMFQLPLAVAVAHNFVALCLLVCLLSLIFNLATKRVVHSTQYLIRSAHEYK